MNYINHPPTHAHVFTKLLLHTKTFARSKPIITELPPEVATPATLFCSSEFSST